MDIKERLISVLLLVLLVIFFNDFIKSLYHIFEGFLKK